MEGHEKFYVGGPKILRKLVIVQHGIIGEDNRIGEI